MRIRQELLENMENACGIGGGTTNVTMKHSTDVLGEPEGDIGPGPSNVHGGGIGEYEDILADDDDYDDDDDLLYILKLHHEQRWESNSSI